MTETEKIENLLRHPPRLKVPSALRQTLQAEIALPHCRAAEARQVRPWLRRWLPALAFSAFFLACLVAIAVQSSLLSELRRENESLRAVTQDLDRLRQENVEYQKLRSENQQLDQLRKDNAEAQKLRDEVARLRVQLQELPSLQADNQRLLAEKKLAESRLPADAQREEDPFDAAQKKAQLASCINNIKQIGLAARMWSNDHKDFLPPDFLTITNELNSPKILVCPADTNRHPVVNWAEFVPGNVTYELLSPGISQTRQSAVLVRCPIHNNIGLVDGSAHILETNAQVVQKDGEWIVQRAQPKDAP